MQNNPTGRPPARDGIVATRVVLREVVPPGEFFAARSGDSPFAPGELLIPGTALPTPVPAFRFPDVSGEPEIPFHARVLIDDDTLIAVDKPHFLPATPNGRIVRETVQTRLRRHYGEDVTVIHRLDRLTAGVLLAVKKPEDRAAYQQLFARRQVHKRYVARVHGRLQIDNWEDISLPLSSVSRRVVVDKHGRPTHTRVRTLQVESGTSVLELEPTTGFTHQLRAVCDYVGHPIVGDDTYPERVPRGLYEFSRPLHLVAQSVRFQDPVGEKVRTITSFRTLPDRLG